MVDAQKPVPKIRPHLLWEYEVGTFDFDRSPTIVIEHVIERDNIEEWREITLYFGKEEVLEVASQKRLILTVQKPNMIFK